MQGVPDTICFDVGGTLFTTTSDTAFKVPYLEAMIKNTRFTLPAKYFIDRSPHHFVYILDHARGNKNAFPPSYEEKVCLIEEATFYGVDSLIANIEQSFNTQEWTRYKQQSNPITPEELHAKFDNLLGKLVPDLLNNLTNLSQLPPNDRIQMLTEMAPIWNNYFTSLFKTVNPEFSLKGGNLEYVKSLSLHTLTKLNDVSINATELITWLKAVTNKMTELLSDTCYPERIHIGRTAARIIAQVDLDFLSRIIRYAPPTVVAIASHTFLYQSVKIALPPSTK